MAIKKDNSREYFDRNKIKNGILKSSEKRPVSIEQVEEIIHYIENEINKTYLSEIESKKIGEMVMDKLKDVDEVAYVRFASVYRQFKDINTFVKELKNILTEKRWLSMDNYIRFKGFDKKCDFVNLAFSNINIGMASKSDRENLCKELNMNFENLTNNKQTHSDIVNIIKKEDIGKIKEGDALVTNLKKTPLLVFVADCVPVAIVDPKKEAVALCHAGWRGTYSKITQKSIENMEKLYETNPEDLVCVLGPSIGPCCYEVSKDLIEKFNTIITNRDEKFYIIKENKYYLDLWKVNELILTSCGVKKENIVNLNICTSCNSDKFHSYRKHNQTTKRLGMILEVK